MAIIVDTNCFSRVFSRSDKEHKDFEPVLNWIINGSGFLVYGGSKYKAELKKSSAFIKIFRLLKDYHKAISFSDTLIDKYQRQYEALIQDPDFDDPHLPAIVKASKCRIICTRDERSRPFVTSTNLYPKRFHTPMYYTGLRDQHLLCDANIDKRLLSQRQQLNKKEKAILESVFM